MKIGFVGLGRIGKAMATRITALGHDLVVWNRTESKAEGLNAEFADDLNLFSDCSVVFLSLGDGPSVRQVLFEEPALVRHLSKGTTIIDTTTISPEDSISIARSCQIIGLNYLEAPILNPPAAVQKGETTFVVGGSEKVFENQKTLLETVGRKAIYF